MPPDKYRNVAPDDSKCYRVFKEIQKGNLGDKILKSGAGRMDGRHFDELRKIYLKTGTGSSIKGSAYVEVGNTKVLVSVYEPREIPNLTEFRLNGELEVEYRYAPFATPSRRPSPVQSDEKDLALMIKIALEPAVCRSEFPNCQVDIHVLVLDNDGSCFSAAITAAGIAVADAGIPMFDTISAATLGIHNDLTFLDPTYDEEEFCKSVYANETEQSGLVSLAYLPSIGQIATFAQTGSLSQQKILDSIDVLIAKCCQIADLAKQRLIDDVLAKCKEEDTDRTEAET